MSCSIWVDKNDIKKIIVDLLEYEEGDALYEGHEIDEFYIESNGAMEGFIEVGPIGFSVQIPFDDWFQQFKKYKAFKELRLYLEKRIEQEEMTLSEFQDLFQSCKETTKKEGS